MPVYIEVTGTTRPSVQSKQADDAILETYLKHANVAGYPEREARAMWSLFRTLTNGRPIAEATREDGRKVVEHLKNGGAKSATIRKKVMWLNAACNLSIKDGRLKFNPFAGILPKCDDTEKHLPLRDSDIRECKRNRRGVARGDPVARSPELQRCPEPDYAKTEIGERRPPGGSSGSLC